VKKGWKGALIGGVIGLFLLYQINSFCIKYSIKTNQIDTSFFNCFGIAGSSCCAFTFSRLFFNIIFLFGIPLIIGLSVDIIIARIKK